MQLRPRIHQYQFIIHFLGEIWINFWIIFKTNESTVRKNGWIVPTLLPLKKQVEQRAQPSKHESPNLSEIIVPTNLPRLALLKPQKRSEVTARPVTPSLRPNSQAAPPPVATSWIFTAVPSFRGKIARETGSTIGTLWKCFPPLWEKNSPLELQYELHKTYPNVT